MIKVKTVERRSGRFDVKGVDTPKNRKLRLGR
jgi:hypothetical protein